MAHTILVIDEESMQGALLCSTLKEKLGHHVIHAASSNEALRYVMTNLLPKPDLILVDVSTASGSCETIANLKTFAAHTPIITMVQYGDYATAIATLNAGAQDFLNKPMATERMTTTFRNALLLRDAYREAECTRQETVSECMNKVLKVGAQDNALPFSLIAEDGNIRRMAQLEAAAIRFAMQYYNGRMTEVARRLGIGRSTLYRKLNELSIRQTEVAA